MNLRHHTEYTRFLIAIVIAAFATPSRSAESGRIVRDLTYAKVDGHELQLDLFLPNSDTRPPLVVWVHGGGWRGGSRKTPPIREITDNGFALASISYRFTKQAIFPAQIHDCKAAIRWLRANAKRYGYNADRITVAGSSAGGHLALLLGVSGDVSELEGNLGDHVNESSRVQAVIDYFGPSDFVLRGRTQPDRAYTEKSGSYALLGGLESGKPDVETERFASPAHYVSADDPPLLIFHGRRDTTVLLDQSERMVQLYQKFDLPVHMVVLDDAAHGGKVFYRDDPMKTAKAFLKSHRPKTDNENNPVQP